MLGAIFLKMHSLAWRRGRYALAVANLGLCAIASTAQKPENTQAIPYLPSASDALGRLGIVRVSGSLRRRSPATREGTFHARGM